MYHRQRQRLVFTEDNMLSRQNPEPIRFLLFRESVKLLVGKTPPLSNAFS